MAKLTKQIKMKSGWGGKRTGAGRPNRSNTQNHARRVRVTGATPLLVTHQINPGFPTLRRKDFLEHFRVAAARAREHGLSILHFHLHRDHLAMIVEAQNNQALGLGMRSLVGSLAKALNSGTGGKVFRDRYHLEVLSNAEEMKHALEQVLLEGTRAGQIVDRFSSAKYFRQWPKLLGRRASRAVPKELKDATNELTAAGLAPARSKLARSGWVRAK